MKLVENLLLSRQPTSRPTGLLQNNKEVRKSEENWVTNRDASRLC